LSSLVITTRGSGHSVRWNSKEEEEQIERVANSWLDQACLHHHGWFVQQI
jgi:hypothetical protein